MKKVNIYTDGACSGNQNRENFGGWGAILEYGEHKKEIFGGESNTTNNRMEMTALLSALQALKAEKLRIHVFSDSSYLMDCFRQKWYIKWIKNDWMISDSPVLNRDLWEKLLSFLNRHEFSFYRVKGHVNLDGRSNFNKIYEKFVEWNGDSFTYDDFVYVTKMNNRADELASLGISQAKAELSADM